MIKKALENNDNMKINTKNIEILKEYFPDCFTKDEEFDIEKFKTKISNNVALINGGGV